MFNMPKGVYIRKQSTKDKMSLAHKKAHQNKVYGFKTGHKITGSKMLGKKHTKATKEKMSITKKGKLFTQEHKNKISLALLGKKRKKDGEYLTDTNYRIRYSKEYKLWRKAVFERDNYTCVFCKKTKTYLNADHIKPFAYYPELRFAIDNGRTLCVGCHKKTDTFGEKAKKFKR